MYSIKAISNLTGIKPETLRTWERRFDFLTPTRDEKGRRTYGEDDLTRLSLIATLVGSGHPIRKLAEMDLTELRSIGAQPARVVRKPDEQALVGDLEDAIGNADLKRFRFLIGYALSRRDPVATVEHVLAPTWRTIGKLWENRSINVGFEHALSSIFKEELFSAIRTLHLSARGPAVVFTTPSGELHEIGLLMGCYIAAAEGCDCQYWGPNLPANDLVECIVGVGAKVLVMSIVHCGENENLIDELRVIAEKLPKSIEFWIGANPANLEALGKLPERALVFGSFEPFHNRLIQVRDASQFTATPTRNDAGVVT